MKADKQNKADILKEFDEKFGTVGKFQNSRYGDFKRFLLSKVKEARELGYQEGKRDGIKKMHENTDSWKKLAFETRLETIREVEKIMVETEGPDHTKYANEYHAVEEYMENVLSKLAELKK
jgi:hypothetical protein